MILEPHFLFTTRLAKVIFNEKMLQFNFFFVILAMEFPAIILMIFFLLRAGRRITLLTLYIICGVALLGTMAIPT